MSDTRCCAKCGEEKPREAFSKHAGRLDGLRAACKSCENERTRAWATANPERKREKNRAWATANPERRRASKRRQYAANPERERNRTRAYREANIEKCRERDRKHYAANPERMREKGRKYRSANPDRLRKWRAANPDRARAQGAKRRALEIERLHPDCDHDIVEDLFDTADLAEAFTGRNFDVDHIQPLSRQGWHHHDNLQVLPASMNYSKCAKTHAEALDRVPGYQAWTEGWNVFEEQVILYPNGHQLRISVTND